MNTNKGKFKYNRPSKNGTKRESKKKKKWEETLLSVFEPITLPIQM